MRVDLEFGALVNKPVVNRWWHTRGHLKPDDAVATMANATTVPCIIVAYWLGEITGYPDWLKKTVDSLVKFYGYTEIKNKPEGCPW